MTRYHLTAIIPGKEPIQGMKSHRSHRAVLEQLRKTAPQWRQVMPGVRFEIRETK
jgi:hypothetical protein